MAGDASAWVESLKEYLEPAAKMAVGVKEQVGGGVQGSLRFAFG